VLFAAVKVLGGQNILHLERPLAIPVHTYGILVAAGFLVAMSLAARAAERSGLNRDKVLDLSFGILIAAMVGSRILFIIVNWDEYAHDLPGIFQFWKGGLVFYGGFIGAVLFSSGTCAATTCRSSSTPTPWGHRRHRAGPGSPGCFAAGCCWAAPATCTIRWRLAFRRVARVSIAGRVARDRGWRPDHHLHPSDAAVRSARCALIFLFLTYWRSRKRFHGELLALYLMMYAPLRALVETSAEMRSAAGCSISSAGGRGTHGGTCPPAS